MRTQQFKRTWVPLVGAFTAAFLLFGILLRPGVLRSAAGLACLSLAAVALAALGLLLVRALLLTPLSNLRRSLGDLREAEDFAGRLASGGGPVADVAFEINMLLETLERKRSELVECRRRLLALFEGSPIGVAMAEMDGTFIELSDSTAAALGRARSEIKDLETIVKRWCRIPAQREAMEAVLMEMRAGRPITGQRLLAVSQRDGGTREVLFTAARSESSDGSPTRYMLHFVDITACREAEDDLRLIRSAIDAIPLGITIQDPSGRILYTNPAEASMHGAKVASLIGRNVHVLAPRSSWNPVPFELHAESLTPKHDSLNVRAGGEPFPVRLTAGVFRDAAGRPTGMVTACEDISESRRAEQVLRESEERHREAVGSLAEVLCTHDSNGVILTANRAAMEAVLRRSGASELVGHRIDEFLHSSARRRFPAYLDALRNRGRADGLIRFPVTPAGASRVFEFHAATLPLTPPVIRLMARDVTDERRAEKLRKVQSRDDRKQVETRARELEQLHLRLQEDGRQRRRVEIALKESEKRFRLALDDAPIGFYRATPEGRIVMANSTLISMLGCASFEELATIDLSKVGFGAASPDGPFRRLMESAGEVRALESAWIRKDGGTISVRENARSIRGSGGEALCYQGNVEDISHSKSLEEQLRQSLKMEALGRLAGGVAHDFNNILTGIIGYSDLSLMRLRESEPLRRNIIEIKRAAERASNLTRQLLAFSRRQILQPKVLGINSIVTDMEKMIRRLVGEDVTLVTNLDPNVGSIDADPGQIEQVILNLAVNARDAMPGGGTLTIATSNIDASVAPDHKPLVRLTVMDTGCGMTVEVKARLFEPFFTTKEKGTGLGLSTVYGVVSQSNGSIHVLSELGVGTTFEVTFPLAEKERAVEAPAASRSVPARNRETVLLVEDDDVVRMVVRETLEIGGFTVIEAVNGEQGLSKCKAHKGPVHIMVTDVVMPGLSGPDLAKRLASLRPDMRVLYMSGYTDDQISHHGVLDAGIAYLQKPFTPEGLSQKVREVLDSPKKA